MRLLPTFAFILALATTACEYIPATDYSSFADMPETGMPAKWEFEFPVTEKDSANVLTGRHDAVLVVRYTDRCPSRSIILNIEEISFSHTHPDSTTIEIPLFSNDGKPYGTGVYGVYEVSDTLHKRIIIPDGYTISVSTPLSSSSTIGIKAIGVVIPRN